jgi:hypothetical protein
VRVSAALVTVIVDATTQRLLLILAAVLVGASVGLIGALAFGLVTQARDKPRRATVVRMPPPPITRPRAEPAPPPPRPFAGSVPALYAVDSEVVRDRHRELYQEEYGKQLRHVDALRRTIGTRLALAGEQHKPSEEPDRSEEPDA